MFVRGGKLPKALLMIERCAVLTAMVNVVLWSQQLSNPETLIHLSPSIICLSSKDVNFPDRQGKQTVELNITFYMHTCYACRSARTATANFRVERQTMSLFLSIRPGSARTVTHQLTVEHYEGGTRVVNKVDMPSGIFRALWRGRMKREQEGFLTALNDAMRGSRASIARSSFARKSKGPLESPLLVTEI